MSPKEISSLLLIEDNPGDARLLREMLSEQGSHTTRLTLVSSLLEAEAYLSSHKVEIILLDLGLPDAQGLDAVRRTRAAAPTVPLVVLTGLDDETLALQALKEGAQDYLVKGQIETRSLLRALHYAIERNAMEVTLGTAFARLGNQSRALEEASVEIQGAHDQLNALLEHSPAVLYSMTVHETTLTPRAVSDNITRLLGFRPEETVHQDWWSGQLHPDDRMNAESNLRQTLVRGASRVEYRMRHKDGSYLWIDDNRRLVLDAEGVASEVVGAWTDVTERRSAQEAQQNDERRFSEMLNNLDLISIMLDAEGKLTYCNDYLLALTGWNRLDATGADWCERFVPSDQADHVRDGLSQLRAGNPASWHNVSEIQTSTRERRLVQWSNAVLRSAGGDVIGSASIGEDITSRRLAERELRRNEDQLRIIIDASTDAIWQRDTESGVLEWSDRAFAMLGYTRETFPISVAAADSLIHPDDVRSHQDVLDSHLQQGLPYQSRIRLRHANGSYLTVLVRGQLQRETGRVFGVFTDLSQVERAEEQLRDQAALIDQAHDAMIVRDLKGRITFWSKGAERLYGWPASDAQGRRIDELLHVSAIQYSASMKEALTEGASITELNKRTSAGLEVIVASRWTLLRDDQGKPKGILSIDTDITERRDYERQLLRTQRLDSLGTLAGGIAHDLNNLLLPIRMGVTLLRRLESDPRSLRAIDNIEVCAKRGTDLVNRVQLFASGSDGIRKPVDLHTIVGEIRAIAESTFPKNISLVASVPDSLRSALGDATQLVQVLLNLCVNARDAMPDGGTITITASDCEIDESYAVMRGGTKTRDYVVIEVSDDGAGIGPEIMDRIFEPFFTTKEVGLGSGLGLSTVQTVLRSHGGFIDASSQVGAGSTFRVCLPAASDSLTVPSLSDTPEEPLLHGNGEVILIVDDEPSILDVTRQTLETSGYAVLTSLNGKEAIALFELERVRIAAIITDMMMPVMDGAALIVAIRRVDPALPIVATSGRIEPNQMARVTRAGATRFLSKPYSGDLLLRTLTEVLRESPATRAGDSIERRSSSSS